MDNYGVFWRLATLAPGAKYAKKAGQHFLTMTLITTFGIAGSSEGRTWHIQADGQGDAPTVQAGIDSSVSGDTVLVAAGTYNENVDFNGKDIVLRSQDGPLVTILDGSSRSDSVVKFHNSESRAAMIIGFTITGGEGTRDFGSPSGGGIKCLNASPTIRQNRIVGNSVSTQTGNGGGIGVGSGSIPTPRPFPLIEQNLIANNSAIGNGGGLSLFHADATVINNVFRGNTCTADGGGVWVLYYDANADLEQNEFWENQAGDHGGGIYGADIGGTGDMTVKGNLFVRNEALAQEGGTSGSGGGIWLFVVSGSILNNTFVGNIGHGASPCSGGAVALSGTQSDLEFRNNILAFNSDCGVACRDNVTTIPGTNLFWQNAGGDVGSGAGGCPVNWATNQISLDPLFCNSATDDYTLARNSPAFSNGETMGAFNTPGCNGSVSVKTATWGRLKAMYR